MGKIKQGILGGFNGTTGSVVGASWKGIAYMRGKAQSIKNPRTTLQMANRGNFGFISDLMSKSLSVVNDGYRAVAVKKSPFNVAVQENMSAMVDPRNGIDLTKAQFSNGSLVAPVAGAVTSTESVISAVVNSAGYRFEGSTLVSAFVFADGNNIPLLVVPSRVTISQDVQTLTATADVPVNLDYSDVKVFSFVYDEETKKASPTTYVGSTE